MREEIAAAVVFITKLVRKNENLSQDQVSKFSDKLSATMVTKFKNHWYAGAPSKGQGYRCIRVNACEPSDPVLERAAAESALRYADLRLPAELTLWVDPGEVSCRFGESKGSHCVLASFNEEKSENLVNSVVVDELITVETSKTSRKQPAPRSPTNAENKTTKHSSSTSTKTDNTNSKNNQNNDKKSQQKHSNKSKNYSSQNRHIYSKSRRNVYHQRAGQAYFSGHSLATGFIHPAVHMPSDRFHWIRGADLVKA